MSDVAHKFAVAYPTAARLTADLRGRMQSTGLTLQSSRPASLGQRVSVRFKLKDSGAEFEALGDIVWVDDAVDAHGRRGVLVRGLALTAPEQQRLDALAHAAGAHDIEVHEIDAHHGHTPVVPAARPAAPQVVVTVGEATAPAFAAAAAGAPVAAAPAQEPKKSRKVLWIVLALLLLVMLSVGGWILWGGGLAWILERWGAVPADVARPMDDSVDWQAEPAMYVAPAPVSAPPPPPPPPKPVYARIVDFSYQQGPEYNKFTIEFDRAPRDYDTLMRVDPIRFELRISMGRIGLDKDPPQYFLPYSYVRTVSFDADGSDVIVSFLATQAYLPRPIVDLEGRELSILFRPEAD